MKQLKPPFHTSLFLLALALLGCRQAPSQARVELSAGHQLVYLDSIQSAGAIVEDQAEGFFGKISPLDMAIQMRRQLPEEYQREDILTAYRAFLQRDVENFTEEEQRLLQQAFEQAFSLAAKLRPGIFPGLVRLIKTKGRHYGPSVFYTRENCIIIPENELEAGDVDGLAQVMLHEVFHIFSRYHPEEREALYRIIGFEALGRPLSFPDSLARRLLLNPDGIDLAYAITLKLEGDSLPIQAIPLIVAARPGYNPSLPQFFSYLDFALYPIRVQKDSCKVLTLDGYRSPLPQPGQLSGFFEQIGNNTSYIIHPDEILADNYVLLLLSKTEEEAYSLSKYSARGQEILIEMESVLREK